MRCTLCAGPAVKRDADDHHCADDEDEDDDDDKDDDDDDDDDNIFNLRRWEAFVMWEALKEI